MANQSGKKGLSVRQVFWLSIAAAIVLTLVQFYRGKGDLSLEEVLQHSWVTDTCRFMVCQGADLAFDTFECQLRDDGLLYEHDKPIARFISAYYPLIPEPAPRTGGRVTFEDLATGEQCKFDSTDN